MSGRNAHKTAGAAGEVVGRSGKLRHINIKTTGDRVLEFREVNASGNIIYEMDTALIYQIHQDLDLGFKDALYVTVASGTTGEVNVIYE